MPSLKPILNIASFLLVALLLGLEANTALAGQGIAQYGKPRYPDGFTHFDYVNPNAPKGGTLVLPNPGQRTSFDKFNPFTLRGITAPGIDLMFESLAEGSADEVSSIYGLLADDIQVAKDRKSVTFHIRSEAKFSDGSPVLAADVKHSFDTLMSGKAHPRYKTTFADIKEAVVLSERVVRFDFKNDNAELPILAGTFPVFSRNWGKRPDGTIIPFEKLAFEAPLASGPYLIESFKAGKSILYKKNPAYWADQLSKPLNIRVGFYNFDRVLYKLYSDDAVRLEAFKAGEFDALVEYRAKIWAKGYVGPKFDQGILLKKAFLNHNGAGMQGFAMN
ncbi:MAG TPA: ABC transporter substrate-binding protein, partial [Polynucleobacter sp.]|nr:ABC transporter substrate-binding protein [Polynucleobacter sp.]